MRVLSRDFNLAEKVLLLLLSLVLVGLTYYHFVYKAAIEKVYVLHEQRDMLEAELTGIQGQIKRLSQMKEELGTLDGKVSRVESYNNAKEELHMINSVLSSANTYNINFANVTREGDLIRRNISLQFTADDFTVIKDILTELSNSPYRCLLGDIHYSAKRGEVASVSVTATFFETMVGGKADAGLPPAS